MFRSLPRERESRAQAPEFAPLDRRFRGDDDAAAVEQPLNAILQLPEPMIQELARVSIIAAHKHAKHFPTADLVFAGFGDHDIFPSMLEYQCAGILSSTP